MKGPVAAAFLLFTVVGPAVWSQSGLPAGAEFQINTYTSSNQGFPSVAVGTNGDFVAVWDSLGSSGSDTSSQSIQGQRFDATGSAVGSEFQINTYTPSGQQYPSVGVDANGNFVVVWASTGSAGPDAASKSIQGRRFDAAGNALSGEFQVNSYITYDQTYPSIAVNPDGDFVVVWRSYGSSGTDSDLSSIQGQRFDTTGSAVGDEFQVNTSTTTRQANPSVGSDADGNFVVVWDSDVSSGPDTSSYSIQAQRFDADGMTVGPEFQVNTYTTNSQFAAPSSVAVAADGSFVVVWTSSGSNGTDNSTTSIQGQRFEATGSAMGDQFQVNTRTLAGQFTPSAGLSDSGEFMVTWTSYGSDGTDDSSFSIQGQNFDSNGIAVGGEFQVNTYTTSAQNNSALAPDGNGNFVVTWMSDGSSGTDSSGRSVQGQRHVGDDIFSDGFESGDTTAWSGTQ